MIELDNLHYDYRPIDSYNKPFNFIMSPREPRQDFDDVAQENLLAMEER